MKHVVLLAKWWFILSAFNNPLQSIHKQPQSTDFLLYHQIIQVHGPESWIWQHLITVGYDPIWSEFLRFWEIKRYLYVFYSINLYFLLNSTIYIFKFLKFKSLPPQIQCVLSQNHCFHSRSCNPLRRNLSFCYKSLNIPIFLRF